MHIVRFPKDVKTYGIDKQFLWGKSLLVTPVLDPGVNYVDGYFPEGLWYDYFTVGLNINKLIWGFKGVFPFSHLCFLLRVTPCAAKEKSFDSMHR